MTKCTLLSSQSLPVPVYGNVSTLTNRSAAAAQREPIEEQDDLHYATIYTSCSENQVQSDQKEQMTDPSQPNNEGITVLHNALCGGHYNVVDSLVCIEANVSAPDSHGW
ncbi:hypothetical protein NHX12_009380 [Muraenolepis orangiensis]|uniref:Uncharacterized protein n=2 Tax=Muraenolepis orangiensis TaxID=630683 RepID=A0A9Q0DMK2_9TELE|nr:hypothetical protein NHX12_009380 [Muraenolepis orangiensis]